MKEYDKVELISDKNKFRELGLEKGRIGTVLGPKRNGYWYVVFEGEIFGGNSVFEFVGSCVEKEKGR